MSLTTSVLYLYKNTSTLIMILLIMTHYGDAGDRNVFIEHHII